MGMSAFGLAELIGQDVPIVETIEYTEVFLSPHHLTSNMVIT